MRKGRGKDQGGCAQGEGEGAGGMHARGGGGSRGDVHKGKGHMQGEGEGQVSERAGLRMKEGGAHPFHTLCTQ